MPHHYTLILIAPDLEPAELPPGLTRDELFAKLTGRTKARRASSVCLELREIAA
jgi:hypothetical protein